MRTTWQGAGRANDAADWRSPVMHVGSDGARMEVLAGWRHGHQAVQLTVNLDSLDHAEVEALRAAIRKLAPDRLPGEAMTAPCTPHCPECRYDG